MSVSLEARGALRELLAQVWRMVEEQAWEMLKQAVEGLLVADRDRRVGEARQRGGASAFPGCAGGGNGSDRAL